MTLSIFFPPDKLKEEESDESYSDSSLSMSIAMSVSMDADKSVLSCAEEVKSQDEVWRLN